MKDFLIEYWAFIREKKAYWLIPLLLVLFIAGLLVVFVQGSAVAPFVYTFF